MAGGDGEVAFFDNVGLRYGTGKEVLTDVSFSLWPGSFYFLTGASGAGKTSLLKLLYLAQRPSRGIIRMFGSDVITMPRSRLPGFRRRLGVVFQDFRLVDHLSAFDNVALPLRIAGVDESELVQPVSDMLDWVGLAHRAEARPETLSGGEKQRVAIARAVANAPRLLLADGMEITALPEARQGWGRLCRLISKGRLRAPKGDCLLHPEDLLDNGLDQVHLVLHPPQSLTSQRGAGGAAAGPARMHYSRAAAAD